MAMGHVILREYHLDRQAEYFEDYARKYTDMPMLVRLDEKDGRLVPGRMLRAEDFDDKLGEILIGSLSEVHLPLSSVVLVKEGDAVVGGETVIARV